MEPKMKSIIPTLVVAAGLNMIAMAGMNADAQQVTSFGASIVYSPGYIVGDWYVPAYTGTVATGNQQAANTIQCSYGAVLSTIHVGELGVRVNTTSSGNVQLGIYATGAWGRPGALLVNSGSLPVPATGSTLTTITSTLLTPGSYWFCSEPDNSTVVLEAYSSGVSSPLNWLTGTVTQGSAASGPAALITGVSLSETFGTWPASFTSGVSWTETVGNSSPVIVYNVSSIP
jgi:hypothetical protein